MQVQNRPRLLENQDKCDNCVIWNMNRKCKMIEYDPPVDYHIELVPTNGKLQPNEVTLGIRNKENNE